MNELILLKLGGSVITHKDNTPPKVNEEAIYRIADELKDTSKNLLIVLGGGAHGHQAAQEFGYSNHNTPVSTLLSGIPKIRHNMSELSLEIETILESRGIPAVVISPFSIALLNDGRIDSFSLNTIIQSINAGLTVITHGDVCYDTKRGASILSGDTILSYLAKQLNAKSVLVGTNVDGVLNDNPNVNPDAAIIPIINESNKAEVLRIAGPSKSTDVTGGMGRKILDLLEISSLGIDVTIFNLTSPGRLKSLLNDEPVLCTQIIA
ncbi:MAG: isopentenyl phosphate kinase [Candidatus Thorarchaeota archaeon]